MSIALPVRMQERMSQLWGPRERLSSEFVYLLPSDRCEMERMCFENYALKTVLGCNYFAPLSQPASILDIGCGPGFWAVDMCHLFPQARVVGLDIVAAPPFHRPANYCFVQGSLLQPLPFADDSFDYVHQRLMWSAIPTWAWRSVLSEMVRVTTPGGCLELVEITPDQEIIGPATAQVLQWIGETSQRSGIDLRLLVDLPALLDLAGARTFLHRVIHLSVGRFQGHKGQLMEQDLGAIFASYAPVIQKQLHISLDQYQRGWNFMKMEWGQRHIQLPISITLAQKTPRRSPLRTHSSLRTGELPSISNFRQG